MKTITTYDIEKAYKDATPDQRQAAIQKGGIRGMIADGLNAQENTLRQKLQTPPPPQGTLMDQYYNQLGLAQPGLEEYAQQMAAGGLVAFGDGGAVGNDTTGTFGYEAADAYGDGAQGYAYGGQVRGFSEGSTVSPFRAIEGYDEAYMGGPYYADVPHPGAIGSDTIRDVPWYDTDRIRSAISEQADKAPDLDVLQSLISRVSGAPERWTNRFEAADKKIAARKEKDAFEEARDHSAERQEDVQKQVANAESGVSMINPHQWGMESLLSPRFAGMDDVPDFSPEKTGEGATTVVTDAKPPAGMQEISTSGGATTSSGATTSGGATTPQPTRLPTGKSGSGVSAEQSIDMMAKFLQVDTTEAARIKGEMEKRAAHEGNLGLLRSIAGAVGLGLGTYGTGSARVGAGLVGLTQGLSTNAREEDARQAKIDELALKIGQAPQTAKSEAFKLMNAQQQAAYLRKQKLEDQVKLEGIKAQLKHGNEIDLQKEKDLHAKPMNEYQSRDIELKQKELALKLRNALDASPLLKGKDPSSPEYKAIVDRITKQFESQFGVTLAAPSDSSGSASPTTSAPALRMDASGNVIR